MGDGARGRLECEPRPPFLLVPPTRVTQPPVTCRCKIAQKQSDAEESGGKEGNQASEEESGDKVGDTKESYMLS